MKTATEVRIGPRKAEHRFGVGRMFWLSEPIRSHRYDEDSNEFPVSYSTILVSATIVDGKPETYIFGCGPYGDICDYSELSGSRKGTLDHVDTLRRAGWEVKELP